MATHRDSPHLRLIADNRRPTEGVTDSISKSSQSQLSFEFSQFFRCAFVREADILKNGAFLLTLEKMRPDFLFDIRLAPRLDFVAANRLLAFQEFRNLNVEYIDVVGACGVNELNETPMPECWVSIVDEKLNFSRNATTSIIFVFDNDAVFRRSLNVLPSWIKSRNQGACVDVISDVDTERIAM
jgi:hypothetical protein